MSSTTTSTYTTTTRHTLSRRTGRLGGIVTSSTPNLNSLYSSQQSHPSRLAPGPPGLTRKASFAALTQSSLASIPDDTEAYAFNSVLTNDKMPNPLTPGRLAPADDISIGDMVDVPGNMSGTVRFVGSVAGRKGTFAGVELHREFAARGKNSGDVDGVFYFTTSQTGAGIFLPLSKATKRGTTPGSAAFSLTPTGPVAGGGLKAGTQNSTNYTPPTPTLPKFSQSVGPGRAPSPTGKRSRPSLPRPDSPVRRLQMTPAPRPSIATPGPKAQTRFGSPTSNKFAQSVRGTAGDPSKRPPAHARSGSIGPRSASALGNSSSSGQNFTDDETTPVQRNKTTAVANGSINSVSSFGLKVRPGSRAASRAGSRAGNRVDDDEVERLRAQLEDRNRQLRDQASTLAEMESSLTELQGLIESSDGPPHLQPQRRGSIEDKDAAQLRALLREKNEKIAMLTAEFDAHRADFRSTIDTLEMASTETERVYDKKIEELMQEIQDLQERTADVDTVATQLKQLEELVQELEEGLEDARRGEAEARGEVEFLRGEVERTRTELRREREKAQTMNGANGTNGGPNGTSLSKELEQKEDEIRGLKAIIHSLSSSAPDDNTDRGAGQRNGSLSHKGESIEDRLSREKLERELADLRTALDSKTSREEELEREIEMLRRSSVQVAGGAGHRGSAMTVGSANERRSSFRDSRGTVVLAPRSPEAQHKGVAGLRHSRGHTLDTMPESDTYSTATENSTLWCEICESPGHDILTCTNMFGPEGQQNKEATNGDYAIHTTRPRLDSLTVPHDSDIKPAPLSPAKAKAPVLQAAPAAAPAAAIKTIPNPMDSGPVAGKDSGVVDTGKWCALCERDGHDSVDCPFEDAF